MWLVSSVTRSLQTNLLEQSCSLGGGRALKGTHLIGQTPICSFLRFPVKICVSQMLCFVGKGEHLQNQPKSAFGLGLSP